MNRTYGIDIGTTFITVYEKKTGAVIRTRHDGKITDRLTDILAGMTDDDELMLTGKGGKETAQRMGAPYVDEAVAVARGLKETAFRDTDGKIIDIGASSLTLYKVTKGKITDIGKNTLCAAGTGLFLEEQAERLNIDLEEMGELNVADPPLIAGRCTVFAKSDLIHHQQEGRSKNDMWAGLCRSLVMTAINTLFRGEEPKGNVMICGGVSKNKEVLTWFRKQHPHVTWLVPENSEALTAAGAAECEGKPKGELKPVMATGAKTYEKMPPLLLKRSRYPEMTTPRRDELKNEIRLQGDLDKVSQVILGMDIGSTSTKLAVLDAQSLEPLLDIYGRTAGDPIEAARNVFTSFYDTMGDRIFEVTAFGTTGSGRLLVGRIFGAHHIVNEISAHGKGTAHFFPGVETIFEIGGQDAKYIRLRDGYVADVNMNYVCAAGTGSFVEEQARKLGFAVDDIGTVTAGIAPAATADRCTVFMEQDLRALLKDGFSREEALASVLYSVIRNYLGRVVGNRPVSNEKIFFQGATARNKGLVAALENLLDVEVVVSPHCHLMGAVGAALLAHERNNDAGKRHEKTDTFVGPAAKDIRVASRMETCTVCRNFCRINYISRLQRDGNDAAEFSWGYQCGRDPEEQTRKEIDGYSLFRQRNRLFHREDETADKPENPKGTVTIVNALFNHTYYPLWKRFFHRLGYWVRLSSRQTDAGVKTHSASAASADYCFPVKTTLGHTLKALEKEDPIFLPYMIADQSAMETAHSFFCPYMESGASVVRSTLARNGTATDRLMAPVIDFRQSGKDVVNAIYNALKPVLPVKRKDVARAFGEAREHFREVTAQMERRGTHMLNELKGTDEPVFLLLGRPYNLYDRGLNLGIPEKIAAMGRRVIPLDMLELDLAALGETNYHNVFWKYGQKILAALRLVKGMDNVFPIYLTNFNCGPDSFLLSFAEEELNGRPILMLELDEHDSDGGYLTRIEAFMDVVHAYMRRNRGAAGGETCSRNIAAESVAESVVGSGAGRSLPHIYTATRRPDLNGIIWVPPMHNPGTRLYSATFRGCGFRSLPLEPVDREAFLLGKKHLRGGECTPMTAMLGRFIKKVREYPEDTRHILLMPTAEGPCRFGQYNLMDRIVLNQLGLHNVDILSPSSVNAYQGLGDELKRLMLPATLCSDIIFKLGTRIRPYEITKGDTDALMEESVQKLERVLETKGDSRKAVKEIADRFSTIAVRTERRPLVGVVGEIYVRSNDFCNGNLINVIEDNGGEAWVTSPYEWMAYVSLMENIGAGNGKNGKLGFKKRGEAWLTNFYISRLEQSYMKACGAVLADRHEPPVTEIVETGARYLPKRFEGEAILTVGRSILFARQGASMVVNVGPFGCMPGTLSGSILLEIKEKMNIPFLSLFYDGDIDSNDKVAALLKTIDGTRQSQSVPREPTEQAVPTIRRREIKTDRQAG